MRRARGEGEAAESEGRVRVDFEPSARQRKYRDEVRAFIEAEVLPRKSEFIAQRDTGERWTGS